MKRPVAHIVVTVGVTVAVILGFAALNWEMAFDDPMLAFWAGSTAVLILGVLLVWWIVHLIVKAVRRRG